MPLLIENDKNVHEMVMEYTRYQNTVSEIAFQTKKFHPISLQKEVYHQVPSALNSTIRCTAIRSVSAAYASAKSNKHKVQEPFKFVRGSATLLYKKDFSFKPDGSISISTLQGRKRFAFTVPKHFLADFASAKSYDCLKVLSDGRVSLCVTLVVPDCQGTNAIGVDLGIRNAIVASSDSSTLFVSGNKVNIANRKARQKRRRLQLKLNDHKTNKRRTRGVRRALKRLGRRGSNRNSTFCKEAAAKLCKWAPQGSILVFEDLKFKQQTKKNYQQRVGTRRKLSQFFYGKLLRACKNRAERDGMPVVKVNPAYTSQKCRKCGEIGSRTGTKFQCLCGHREHADVNASHNIRLNYTALRSSGPPSSGPEATSVSKKYVLRKHPGANCSSGQ
jgi:IS605 OrfB family transposase